MHVNRQSCRSKLKELSTYFQTSVPLQMQNEIEPDKIFKHPKWDMKLWVTLFFFFHNPKKKKKVE